MATKKKAVKKKKKGEKHAGGAPTKYNKGMVKKTLLYIESCYVKWIPKPTFDLPEIEDELDHDGEPVKNRRRIGGYHVGTILDVKLPSIEGLANYLDISKDTVYEWEEAHKEFSDVVKKVRSKQAEMLINNGISGTFSSPITKVMLSKHDYREATEVEEQVTHKIDINKMLDKAYGDQTEEE